MNRLIILLVTVFTSCQALGCEPDSVAIRYVQAIDNMQWDTMGELLDDAAQYTDPTMVYYGTEAIEIEGKENIVAFWKRASEDSGTSDIRNDVTACFETGGYHLINLDILITLAGSFWNVNVDELAIPGKQLMVIRVSDEGKVVEHHDYVGYAGGDVYIKEMQKKHGKLDPSR